MRFSKLSTLPTLLLGAVSLLQCAAPSGAQSRSATPRASSLRVSGSVPIAAAKPGVSSATPAPGAAANRAESAANPAPGVIPKVAGDARRLETNPAPVQLDPSKLPRLGHFQSELNRLRRKQRERSVHVAWFGDSHTAADFLTGEVRRRLQREYGEAGPGFVHLGNAQMRHDEVRSEVNSQWRLFPALPAAYRPSGDTQVGLSGQLSISQLGSRALVELPKTLSRVNWTLLFRGSQAAAAFDVSVGQRDPLRIRIDGSSVSPESVQLRSSGILGYEFDTEPGEHRLNIKGVYGAVEFFGAYAETATPGVVLDTLGLNGARIRTQLGWSEAPFEAELAAREPELVVLAYGTNEAGDNALPGTYAPYYEEVLRRVRRAAPGADCLLLGPTDRRNQDGTAMNQVVVLDVFQEQLAQRLGCGYFSLLEAMGGSGGFSDWANQHPGLASSDGVHLTIRGYQRLGQYVGDMLLGVAPERPAPQLVSAFSGADLFSKR